MGLEPDESYCIGSEKEIPDLAIEVIVTSGGIDRLERFRRLGVPEVWFWQGDRFSIYHLREPVLEQIPELFSQTAGYGLTRQSESLPELDMEWLSECLRNPNPLAAAKAFRQRIRQRMR